MLNVYGVNLKILHLTKRKKIAFNGAAYDFPIDYGAIDVKDLVCINDYLMEKHNIK